MSLELPGAIAAFFAAQSGDGREGLDQHFTHDAVVRDEGRTMEGLKAIHEWRAETKRKYQHTIDPLSSVQKDGTTIVTSRVAGNFPGSPVDLQFVFKLEAEKIASLEIH
jgi:hypothetical protein